jgi:hypothetical protein
MKSNLPVPTAKNINEAHRMARSTAESAVEWAVKCGELLKAKKEEVGHGNWESWVGKNCEFTPRSASAYMKVATKQAQIGSTLPISSIRQALEDDKPKAVTPKGAVSVVKPQGTEETGDDRPAAPVFDEPKRQTATTAPTTEPDSDEPEFPNISDDEEAAALEQAETRAKADRERRIDAILQAEDQLGEAVKQIAQQSALIGVLETTRDGYMRGKEAVTKMLQAEQRKVTRLEKENKNLHARLASLEGKAA